jgi:hypothetical protein
VLEVLGVLDVLEGEARCSEKTEGSTAWFPSITSSTSSTSSGTIPAHGSRNSNRVCDMNRLFAALGAGWGAKKLGGGCFTTVLIFLLLYWLLRSI